MRDARLARVKALARPAKLRGAVHRREFEWRLGRLALEPLAGLEDVGTSYGGWTIPTPWVDDTWTCYSIGAGADVSFDTELVRRFGARVRSIEPVETYVRLAAEAGQGLDRFSAHRAAIAPADGVVTMQRSHEAVSESLSAASLYDSSSVVEVPARSVPSLMREFGDARVDLLKIDVEGLEYELIPQFALLEWGVQILTFQVHHNRGVRDVHRLLHGLREQGFRLVANRPTLKLTLVRGDGAGPAGPRP